MSRGKTRTAYKRAERLRLRTLHAHMNTEYVSYDKNTGQKTKKNPRSHTFTRQGQWRNPSYGDSAWHRYQHRWTVNLLDTVTYGKNVPGWRDKMRRGEGVVTTMTGCKMTLKVDYGGEASTGPLPTKFNAPGSEDACNGPFGAFSIPTNPAPNSSISATALQQARSKLLQSYINQVQNFSGGKFLAELKDSIELVTHPVRSVYRKTWEYATTVKKIGKIYQHRPRTAAAALSESWLAFSFGVKPLLQDANDAARALNTLVQNPRENLRYVKGSGRDVAFSQSREPQVTGYGVAFDNLVTSSTLSSVRFTGAFRQQPTGTDNLLSEFGLGVLDIAPSVWEGIPWSFFIDYFANVGECLDAWRFIGVDQAWLILEVLNLQTVTCSPQDGSYRNFSSRRYIGPNAGTAVLKVRTFQRTPTIFFNETPQFHFKLPGTNLSRLLNITSLAGVINDSRWGSRPDLGTPKLTDRRYKPGVPFKG